MAQQPLTGQQAGADVEFTHTFGGMATVDEESLPMPTDYLRYEVTARSETTRLPHLLYAEDHAFLLEAQEVIPLPAVREADEGAAPDTLIVRYCDMIPFRHTAEDGPMQLVRSEVPGYVREQLIPRMVEAFRIETDEWGFPWHEEWSSYRPEDGEQLGVALTDGETWYHGLAPAMHTPASPST